MILPTPNKLRAGKPWRHWRYEENTGRRHDDVQIKKEETKSVAPQDVRQALGPSDTMRDNICDADSESAEIWGIMRAAAEEKDMSLKEPLSRESSEQQLWKGTKLDCCWFRLYVGSRGQKKAGRTNHFKHKNKYTSFLLFFYYYYYPQ